MDIASSYKPEDKNGNLTKHIVPQTVKSRDGKWLMTISWIIILPERRPYVDSITARPCSDSTR